MPIEWPLPLWQVLREELAQLRPALEAGGPAAPDEVDWSIAPGGGQLEIIRHEELRAGLRARLEIDPDNLLPAIDELLSRRDLWRSFRDVPEHRWVADQEPATLELHEVRRLNRYLLERAFPGAFRSVDDRILSAVTPSLHDANLSALTLSGGGIRSATFALGVVQALASNGVLDKFDYLSTVSGGGYLGAWLDAWSYHDPGGLADVIRRLSEPTGSKLEPEPDPVFYLRNFSNYLTPQKGLFSIDTWTLIGIYLRNLTLNWTVILPLLMAVLAIPYLLLAFVYSAHLAAAARLIPAIATMRASLARPGPSFWAAVLLLGIATGYEGVTRPSNLADFQRARLDRWISRGASGFVGWFLIPVCVSFLLLARHLHGSAAGEPVLVLYGVAAALVGCIVQLVLTRRASPWQLGVLILSGAVGGFLLFQAWPLARIAAPLYAAPRRFILLAPTVIMAVFLLTATMFIAFSSWWTDDDDREFWARMGAWALLVTAAWIVLVLIALFSPELIAEPAKFGRSVTTVWAVVTAAAGLVSTVLSWSRKTPAHEQSNTSGLLLIIGLQVLGVIAIVGVLAALASLNAWLVGDASHWIGGAAVRPSLHAVVVQGVAMRTAVAYFAALIAISFVMGFFIDVNSFSLHGMYRNRLIRAYLGASRAKGEREPNPFTGFDPRDNLAMRALWPKEPRKLLPVVNVSLNLVETAAEKLAWQERKAESFTVTPLHSGNFRSGYRRSSEYAGESFSMFGHPFFRGDIHSISLGTATAVSGAAVSPNMGYISSPVLTFLLTLFNVRLGWWLGNPGPAGNGAYWRLARPRLATMRLLDEALGRTNDQRPYVYLSDGGHFENLGLYEMVLRRCRTIVVIDADADKDLAFQNFGNAIRKIRIDLGIDIEFPSFPTFKKRQRGTHATVYCAAGRIRYAEVDGDGIADGRLIYVKPTIRGDEPTDVLNYESIYPDFPHQTTADQWFTESQFESYRALGRWEMERILAGEVPGDPFSVDYRAARAILDGLRT